MKTNKNRSGILIASFFIICILTSDVVYAVSEPIPDLFDDFSDGKYNDRTGIDPWGRGLPNWTVEQGGINASNGYAVPTSFRTYHSILSTQTNITSGTWIFKYKYLNGTPEPNNYYLGITAKYLNPSSGGDLHLNNPMDGHWWLDFTSQDRKRVTHSGYISNMAGSQIDSSLVGGNSWHEVVFIKDENNYTYSWLDGELVRWSTDKTDDISNSNKFVIDFYDVTTNQLQYPIAVDDVRIYRNQYLPPSDSIVYDPNLGNIIINGFDANLKEIADEVNDSSIFSYDLSTNSAISYTNIIIKPGAELEIEDGTLLMNSSYDGELMIGYYNDPTIKIINSTVASTNDHYFCWKRLSGNNSNLKGIFKVVNSTIDNSAGLYFERPVTFYVENSNFSNLNGYSPVQVYFRWPTGELKIQNTTFSGKTGKEKIIFCGGDQFRELSPKPVGVDIVDCDFSQTTLECILDAPYYLSPKKPGCTVNLINTKTNSFSGNISRQKYYLDVEVTDSTGNPVPDVEVSIKNEVDDFNYPAENMLQGKEYFQLGSQLSPSGDPYFSGQTANWIAGLTDINDHRTTTTGINGHTPLPSDTVNTLVVTALELNESEETHYTYTITASKDGYTSSLPNITIDSSWLRSDPNKYSKTITLVLPINASPENHAPILDQIENKSVTTDSLLEFTVTAVDQDDDALEYSAIKVPDGANFDNLSGVFTWTPTINQTGNHTVTFEVTDGNLTDTEDVTITVNEKDFTDSVKSYVNLSMLSNQVIPGETFKVDILIDPSTPITGAQLDFTFDSSMASASDVTEGDFFKQSGASTIFSGGTIDNSAGEVKYIYGLILGTSSVSTPGTFATVNLTAGNRTGMAEFSLSNVLISDANSKSTPYTVTNASVLIDTPPVMNPICCLKSIDEKSTLAFKVSAKDADGDNLILSASSGLPEGAVFNTTSGMFIWTPARGQAGVYTFNFEVSDGYLTDSENVTVTVNRLNKLPVIDSFEPLNGSSFSEGERIGISVNASDADGQSLKYSIMIDGVTCSTGTSYVWETDYSSSGSHTLEVTVSDGIDEVKEQHTIYISDCHPRWDVNEDGKVNILDITRVSQMYGTTVSKPYPRYDVNQDGVINIQDLTLVGYHFGEKVE